MTAADQPALIAKLAVVISEDRLGTYLTAAGFDQVRALNLYLWNARLGEAFHVPIQAVEVGLRNRVNQTLTAAMGADWWRSEDFQRLADEERRGDLELVFRRIRNRDLPLATGQVVAGLSFGFWVALLQKRYNPGLWSAHLNAGFPDLPPDRSRKSLAEAAGHVVTLRNRIWHHEPIIKRDLSRDYATVMQLLGWICPVKLAWVKPHCRVPQLLRQKP